MKYSGYRVAAWALKILLASRTGGPGGPSLPALARQSLNLNRDWGQVLPQHFLNFLPLPQGQGSLRPTFGAAM